MNLKYLSDTELLNSTDSAVKNELDATTQVLHHFQEIERRRLYSAEKFGSLYEMATKKWRYTEDQAMYRISAMRLLKELPEIEAKVSSGSLTLTHLNIARAHFRKEKKHLSKELSREQKLEVLKSIENMSARESKKVLRSYSSVAVEIPRDEIKALTDTLVLLRFAADKSVEEQVARLKGLLAHAHPDLTLGELFQKLCTLGLKEWSPVKEPKRSPGTFRVTAQKMSKAAQNRSVWLRDEQKCTNCGSNFAVERDHRYPKAKGGPDTPENMRLLCRKCNQRAAIEMFGLQKMDPYLNKTSMAVKSPWIEYMRAEITYNGDNFIPEVESSASFSWTENQ